MHSLRLFFLLWLAVGMISCQPEIQPLADSIFRLRTIHPSDNCVENDKKICRTTLVGTLVSQEIVQQGDNPFSDCANCSFNQKFSIQDAQGTLHYFYYKLPQNEHIPLVENEAIRLLFIRGDSVGRGFAVLLQKSTGETLFVATSGDGGELFQAGDLKDILVQEKLDTVAGISENSCGKKTYRALTFQYNEQKISLIPGEVQEWKASDSRTFLVANGNLFHWENAQCSQIQASFAYYLFWKRK